MTPTGTAATPATKPDAQVLAASCRRDLMLLARMPYDAEYVTPQEILRIVHLCRVYGVDWSLGLEPTGAQGERLRRFRVVEGRGARAQVRVQEVRIRREVLLQDFQGTDVPDGDILWAMDVLGALRSAVTDTLRLNLMGGF